MKGANITDILLVHIKELKMIKLLVAGLMVLCASVLSSERAAARPGHCTYHGKVIPESGDFVPAPIGFCLKIKCVKAEGNTLSMLTCPSMQLPPGSHWSEKDLTKEYPHCCPKAIKN
ncbi:hypothetical protein FQR65_LT04835 [Abscondita terminalis]|nr:hypothetical protein FQR65_LT04835 [Abscondita terminalis]